MKILLTGGSGNGKSTFARALALHLEPPHSYIDTARPYNEHIRREIKRTHTRLLESGFTVYTCGASLSSLTLLRCGTLILECMCHLTANMMFDENGAIGDPYSDILTDIKLLEKQCDNLIVVTNDVGSGDCCYDYSTRQYIRMLGRLNQALAEDFDLVYELVCGIPLPLK